MSLIDRYIHEVGRHLPRKNRMDIQAELRSAVIDTLEDRTEGEPSEVEIEEVLKEFGPPKEVAISYYPQGEYLIGPSLFPLFRMVAGITLAAVLGAQLLAQGIAIIIAQETFAPLNILVSLLNSIPASLGMVLIVFIILQWFDVKPEIDDELWEPKTLPEIDEKEDVKQGERIFSIVVSVLLLVLLVFFPEKVGFVATPNWKFFPNPVIGQYLVWIVISLLASIGLDIYILWQGRWETTARVAKIAVNLLSIVVLFLLLEGHSAWLVEHGEANGIIATLGRLPEILEDGWQLVGMQAFRLAFGVALIVTSIETLGLLYRLVTKRIRLSISLKKNVPQVD